MRPETKRKATEAACIHLGVSEDYFKQNLLWKGDLAEDKHADIIQIFDDALAEQERDSRAYRSNKPVLA